MASQKKVLAGLVGMMLLVVGAGTWFALTGEPSEGDGDIESEDVVEADTTNRAKGSTANASRSGKPRGECSVFGRVKFKRGEKPAEGQEIVFAAKGDDRWTLRTDAAGSFRFTEIPRGGPYELSVAAEGYATVRLPGIGLDRREERDMGTLWLDAAVSQTVIVKDYRDQPIEGAEVQAFVASTTNVDWTARLAQFGAEPVPIATLTTDAAGTVTFPELATGTWTFVADAEGRARNGSGGRVLSSENESKPLTLYLGLGFELAGNVLDGEGTGISGALVLAGPNTGMWDAAGAVQLARFEADEQGAYAFDALPAGDIQIWAARPGGVPAQLATLRVPNVNRYDIRLIAGGVLEGKVTLEVDGSPVADATVRATGWSGSGQRIAEATTDAEGNYAIDTLLEGTINALVVEKTGLVQVKEIQQGGWQQIPLNRDDTIVRDLKMSKASTLSGVVRGAAGPLEGASVQYFAMQPGNQGIDQKTVTSDGDGVYRFDGLREGKALLQVTKAGSYQKGFPQNWWMALQQGTSPEEFTVEIPAEGEATKDLELLPGLVLKGRVEMADGTSPEGTKVQASTQSTTVAADGSFAAEGVAPSPMVFVWAQKDGYAGESKQVAVAEDEPPEEVVITLVKTGFVRGTVVSKHSAELRDAYVQLVHVPERSRNPRAWFPQSFAGARGGARSPVLADGTYEIAMPFASGSFTVRASALEHEQTLSEPVKVVPGQDSYQVDVALGGGATLRGRVIVKTTTEGIPGAEVALTPGGGSRSSSRVNFGGMIDSRESGGPKLVYAITRDDGTFEVPNLSASAYTAAAKAEGYVDAQKGFKFPDENDIDIVSERELEITGAVRLANGDPVAGVFVSAQKAGAATNPGMPMPFGGGGSSSASTGSDGGFRLQNLKSGEYRLQVTVPWNAGVNVRGHKSDPVAAGSTDVKVTVQAGLTIKGKIVDPDDEPLAGIWISAQPKVQGAQQAWHNAQSGRDGSFELTGLSEGTYDVTVNTSWGSASEFVGVTRKGVTAGEQGLKLQLQPGLTIDGVVRDENGKPAANQQLWVQPIPDANAPSSNMTYRQSSTDAEGKFVVKGLAPGSYRITAQQGYFPGGGQGKVLSGGEKVAAGTRGVTLTLSEGLSIEGVVVDENGGPLAHVRVWASPKGGGNSANAAADENGEFKLSGLLPNTSYTVNAHHQGRKQTQIQDVQSPTTGLRIVMERGLEISGVLRDAGGNALAGTYLQFAGGQGRANAGASTQSDGSFTVTGLDEGEYTVSAYVRHTNDDGTPAQGGAFVQIGTVTAPNDNATLTLPD